MKLFADARLDYGRGSDGRFLEYADGSLRMLSPIDHNGQKHPGKNSEIERVARMTSVTLIEQELAAAQAAQQKSNDGKARVCARRAVARAAEMWEARIPSRLWRGDAMAYLRNIQRDASFPPPVRQAAERLSTPITHQYTAPFTTDPVADARLIIAYLSDVLSETTITSTT